MLKPENMSYEQNRSWRPQTGMVPSNRNVSLGAAGEDLYTASRYFYTAFIPKLLFLVSKRSQDVGSLQQSKRSRHIQSSPSSPASGIYFAGGFPHAQARLELFQQLRLFHHRIFGVGDRQRGLQRPTKVFLRAFSRLRFRILPLRFSATDLK